MERDAAEYAASIGFQIVYADLTKYGRVGMCDLTDRIIYIQPGMLQRKERGIVWHELAHATFSDSPSIFEHVNQKLESRADEWASHQMIDHHEYMLAEEKYGDNTEWIAEELNVLHKFVIAYERTLHRIGDCVYVRPKLGVGAWDARYEVVA